MTEKILLEIQSSVRQHDSTSRQLSGIFIEVWRKHRSPIRHLVRDVGMNPPDHVTEFWVKANYTAPEARSPEMNNVLAPSDTLINELLTAHYLVLAIPMYNFSVPSHFKTYIDNIVRVGHTFVFDRSTATFQGLAAGKKALLISPSAANYASGTAMAAMDFCEPYVQSILRFIGIDEIVSVKVPDQFMPEEIRRQAISTAKAALLELAKTW
jgi:FMN-dependent NADH-azoreductase